MKILYLLKSKPDRTLQMIMEIQKKGNDLKIVELTKGPIAYEDLIDDIFAYDRVISW